MPLRSTESPHSSPAGSRLKISHSKSTDMEKISVSSLWSSGSCSLTSSDLSILEVYPIRKIHSGLSEEMEAELKAIFEGDESRVVSEIPRFLWELKKLAATNSRTSFIGDIAYGHPWMFKSTTLTLAILYLAELEVGQANVCYALVHLLAEIIRLYPFKLADIEIEQRLMYLSKQLGSSDFYSLRQVSLSVAFLWKSSSEAARDVKFFPPITPSLTASQTLPAASEKISFKQIEEAILKRGDFSSASLVAGDLFKYSASLLKGIPFEHFYEKNPESISGATKALDDLFYFTLGRILREGSLKKRRRMHEFSVRLVSNLLKLGDFATSFSIMTALSNSSVEKLDIRTSSDLLRFQTLFSLFNLSRLEGEIEKRRLEAEGPFIFPLQIILKRLGAIREREDRLQAMKLYADIMGKVEASRNSLVETGAYRTDIVARMQASTFSACDASLLTRKLREAGCKESPQDSPLTQSRI